MDGLKTPQTVLLMVWRREERSILCQACIPPQMAFKVGRNPENHAALDEEGLPQHYFSALLDHGRITLHFFLGTTPLRIADKLRRALHRHDYAPVQQKLLIRPGIIYHYENLAFLFIAPGQVIKPLWQKTSLPKRPSPQPKKPKRPHSREKFLMALQIAVIFFIWLHFFSETVSAPHPSPAPPSLVAPLQRDWPVEIATPIPTPEYSHKPEKIAIIPPKPLTSKPTLDSRPKPTPLSPLLQAKELFLRGHESEASRLLLSLYEKAPLSSVGSEAGNLAKTFHGLVLERRRLLNEPASGEIEWKQFLDGEKRMLGNQLSSSTRKSAGDFFADLATRRLANRQFEAAKALFDQALEMNPHAQKAQEGLQHLIEEARRIYARAYIISRINPEESRALVTSTLRWLPEAAGALEENLQRLQKE